MLVGKIYTWNNSTGFIRIIGQQGDIGHSRTAEINMYWELKAREWDPIAQKTLGNIFCLTFAEVGDDRIQKQRQVIGKC